MQNVFITGINGFVGCQLAGRLQREGLRVVGLAKERNYKSHPDILDKCSVIYGDLADASLVRDAVSRYEIDTIFHLGAVAIIRVATLDPLGCFSSNIMGTASVLEAARQCKVNKTIIASTDKAYGTQPTLPYTEDMGLRASDPYSTSKACSDLLAQSYALAYGVDVSILRPGNIYGPGDMNLSRMIPGNIIRALKNQPLRLYRGVENDRREYMFIEDVIDAYLAVAAHGVPGEAYNVGGTGSIPAREVMDGILSLCGSTAGIEILDRDFIEIKEQFLDATKLGSLGWGWRHNFQEGLEKTVPWYRESMHRFSRLLA